jgi:phytoene/squalene synthetase
MSAIPAITHILKPRSRPHGPDLAVAITRAASKQASLTVDFLVDPELRPDAYRAYAYFRWLDDRLDGDRMEKAERRAFVRRQWRLVEGCYRGEGPASPNNEEELLVDLIRRDPQPNSGLQVYIRRMMAIMAFDAERQGRLISSVELAGYTQNLAAAVTEALHYFIGHAFSLPRSRARYCGAAGAHIVHMLRDTVADVKAGYFNVPREYLAAHGICPDDLSSPALRDWVRARLQLARACFESGGEYLAGIGNRRFRMAGHAYMARFAEVMDAIERDDYRLRQEYPECRGLRSGLRTGWALLSGAILP